MDGLNQEIPFSDWVLESSLTTDRGWVWGNPGGLGQPWRQGDQLGKAMKARSLSDGRNVGGDNREELCVMPH